MPTKIKEKEPDKDLVAPRTKEKHRHHKSSRSTHKPKKASTPTNQSAERISPTTKRRASIPESKSDRVTPSDSPLGSKSSLPYPSFSKEHSKEAVGSRDNVRLDYYTPDPTDLEQGNKQNVVVERRKSANVAPPSPPETTVEEMAKMDKQRVESPKFERKYDLQKRAEEFKKRLIKSNSTSEVRGRKSDLARSRPSQREGTKEDGRSGPPSAKSSKPGTPSKQATKVDISEELQVRNSPRMASSSVHSTTSKSESLTESTDSDATSIAPTQFAMQIPSTPQDDRNSSSALDVENEPKTPTVSEPHYPLSRQVTPAFSINGRFEGIEESPMPPPPPPPPDVSAPRVDYLLKNGGLPQEAPRRLSVVGRPAQLSEAPGGSANYFQPFNYVLEDYMKVISKNGSIAVATGYRSIARRLLDRLEAVFARDISSEVCHCRLCQSSPDYSDDSDDARGVSWGEILEYVSGRQILPQWPPFCFDNVGLGIAGTEQATPMQKLDIDVPEEFRAHYIRQSKKTKQTVDKWLESQPADPINAPTDVDDETLTFAMLTRLDPDQRPTFKSLLGVPPSRPVSAAESIVTSTVTPSANSPILSTTGLAIQRLYRLPTCPRDPESALFLLNNPHLHNVLATLAAVSDQEWEILISGRFDGFLRSGAEDIPNATPNTNHSNSSPSRGPTPGMRVPSTTPSRAASISHQLFSASPASHGAPVALDEETEIAILAEVEREIYLGMESLEDAFEALHQKAEIVHSTLDARMGTPASAWGDGGWDGESTDGENWDVESELAPDDSASNVSRSRVRRPKRRTERRTPAPVEEEDEEVDEREKEKEKEKEKPGEAGWPVG
ncbi:uncharacterized protein KY384_008923 [Bacidia gigantensis]|uniref:uncharacterized protein n=1 Tax=Bacidia gigantensis TaxID=2732470 RepID=UPI001D041189|nr:uncharacterized protein KY384_008923 [Bacidia gigantensis]KAG8525279.1 hypothetical protein KY384_008923 [Bacidia gigantensis]